MWSEVFPAAFGRAREAVTLAIIESQADEGALTTRPTLSALRTAALG